MKCYDLVWRTRLVLHGEAAAVGAPAVEELVLLRVGEVVVGEVEGAQARAEAGGGEEALEALADEHGGPLVGAERVLAADEVVGEVEADERRALRALGEQGPGAGGGDVVEREDELGERGVVLERGGEAARADAVHGVAREVDEHEEAAEVEGARVVGERRARDVVVVEAEAREARAPAEAVGEAVRVVGAHAHAEVEGAEGGAVVEARGEVLHAGLREVVVRDVEVRERAEGAERLGELVDVVASVFALGGEKCLALSTYLKVF